MADVGVTLGIDAQELYQELQNVTAKFVTFSTTTTQAGEKAGSGFAGGFKGGLGGIGSSVTGALAGLGLGAEIKSVVEYGAHVQDLSDRFGVSVISIQKFGNAAEKNGSSLEAVAKGFRFLEVAQAKALGGNDAMVGSFANLGVSIGDLKSLSPEEIMLKLGSSSLNAADTVKVLGREAIGLRPTLAGLADGTITFGNAMNALDIARLKEAEDAFKTLKETTTIFTGTILGGFISAWEQGINSIISLLQALGVSVAANVAGIGKILHGDLSGGAHDIAEGVRGAIARVKAGEETNKDLAGGQASEERKRRDFGIAPEDSEAGESDDQGRPLKRTAEDRGADREANQLEREQEKLRKTEEERRLGALSFEDRNKEQKEKAAGLLAGSEANYPELGGGGEELKRVQLKNEYYELVKQIESDEKKHGEEMERSEKERTREKEKAGKEAERTAKEAEREADRLSRLSPKERLQEATERAQQHDLEDRRAHGSYTGPGGGIHSGLVSSGGLVTGGLKTGSLSDALSDKDFHAQFQRGGGLKDRLSPEADFKKQFEQTHALSRADQVKQAALGKDAGPEKPGVELKDAAKDLKGAAKELTKALTNQ